MDVNAQRNDHLTPLHIASYNGNPDIARVLLDHGAEANAVDNLFRTPLDLVAAGLYESKEGGARVAQLLLERGADANALDLNRQSALHSAASSGRLEIVQILLEHATVKDDQGRNPSHQSLQGGYCP